MSYLDFNPPDYRCNHCDATGLKLWRGIGFGDIEAWCAACATLQAGLPDDVGDNGRREGAHGPSDQVYNPDCGLNLLPYVPCSDGSGTWGYTSVPLDGVEWWRRLPTRSAS